MEREERKQHFSTERKLETISFLRRSAAEINKDCIRRMLF